ncbi:hypothetical protein COO91_08626 [Nostoc flagelliforme CCNUN1]|uniref:Uncharacterized protein n=1 Tax=Nostoc flagelliforme CCNUN1 TaxID=2038116 RepID=A0A2K8T4E3_9NOSO|nr:hypothetical protein COO91_08626 [Nostoc flagelliforme CCNUN1]
MQRKSEVPLALFNITYLQGNFYVKNVTFLIAENSIQHIRLQPQ